MHTPNSYAPLRTLFARYLAGEIEESLWSSIMSALDARETSHAERMALVTFLNDATSERWVGTRPVQGQVLHEVVRPMWPAYAGVAG